MRRFRDICLRLGLAKPGRTLWGRLRSIVPPDLTQDDVLLCSYPRSGNTWVRYLLSRYRTNERAGMEDFDRLVPDLHAVSAEDLRHAARPRILKSHLGPSRKYRRIVYLLRDPRDVVCSYHAYLTVRRKYDGGMDDFIADSLGGRIWPGRWDRHVRAFERAARHTPVHFFRYEDLRQAPEENLLTLAADCGLGADPQLAAHTVACTGLTDYRRDTGLFGYEDAVRGETGSWKTKLSASQAAAIETAFAPVMARWGYDAMT